MNWFEISFYSILLFGILIGIGIGLYAAFHLSKHKIDRKEYKDYNAEERAKAKRAKAQAKQEAKEKKKAERQKQKEEREHKAPAAETILESEESNELSGRMAEIVSERQELESLTDFNCDIDGADEQEVIEEARQKSNEAYRYLDTKKQKANQP